MNNAHVCPLHMAGLLDNWIRRLIHNPKHFLKDLIEPGQSVLDLGCGPGTFTIDMAKIVGTNGKVFAVDLQQGMLELVEKKAHKYRVKEQIVLHPCNSQTLGLTEPVDFVLAFYMLHESSDPVVLLRQIRDILKPGGKLLLVEPKMHIPKDVYLQAVEDAKILDFQVVSERKIPGSWAIILQKQTKDHQIDTIKEREKYWSRFAEDFDDRQNYVACKAVNDLVKAKLQSEKKLGKVLEFGCGNGGYTRSIIAESSAITATDLSCEMVEVAKRVFTNHPKIRVEQANCHKSPYTDQSFDTILMANLIHIVDNPTDVLKECHRLLKPNGIILLTCFTTDKMSVWNKLTLLYRYKKTFGRLPPNRTSFTLKGLTDFVGKSKFDVQEATLLGKKTKVIFIKAVKRPG